MLENFFFFLNLKKLSFGCLKFISIKSRCMVTRYLNLIPNFFKVLMPDKSTYNVMFLTFLTIIIVK